MKQDKPNRDKASLLDIIIHAKNLPEFISGMNYDDFCADYKTQAAVCREIEIIGEASNRLTPEFQLNHPEIPWSEIIGMRNIVAHNYDGIDLYALWQVANTSASDLVTQIEAIFKILK